jgi:RNA polymerase sigma-70 factor, ECF subfamily
VPIQQDILIRVLLAERAKVLAFIRALGCNRETTLDVYQDVCVLAVEKREQIVDEKHLLAWLRVSSRLRARSVLRRARQDHRILSEAVHDLLEPHWRQQDGVNDSAMAEALRACMAGLGPKAARILHSRYFDDLPVDEVARQENRPVGSVYVSLSRIHADLSDCVFKRLGRRSMAHG